MVGHSQGMSALYVMLSNYPSIADNISLVGFQSFDAFKTLCNFYFSCISSVQCFLFVHSSHAQEANNGSVVQAFS